MLNHSAALRHVKFEPRMIGLFALFMELGCHAALEGFSFVEHCHTIVGNSDTKSNALSGSMSHRSTAKAGSARLQMTGKQKGWRAGSAVTLR